MCLQQINIPDKKKGRVNVPCGRCPECLSQRRNDWSFRLVEELKHSTSAYFITLTYTDDQIPYRKHSGQQTLDKRDVQLFIKKLRKRQETFLKQQNSRGSKASPRRNTTIRYYIAGEYGSETQRPHYHCILFNVLGDIVAKIEDIWTKGHTHIANCNVKTIAYTTKYVMKKLDETIDPKYKEPEFSLMSRKPALGHQYIERNKTLHKNLLRPMVRNSSGKLQRMPRYYKDKIFEKYELNYLEKESQRIRTELESLEEQRILRTGSEVDRYKLSKLKEMLRKVNKEIKQRKKL